MGKKKVDLYIGIGLIVIMLLNLLGVLGMIGITQRFVDIVVVLVGCYLVYMGMK